MRDLLTTLLDTLGLLLLAAGAGVAVLQWRIGVALAVSGVVVIAGSAFAAWQHRPEPQVRQ